MIRLALLAFLTLTACGADGAPEKPTAATPANGVTMSGSGYLGVGMTATP
ncbi:MAG: hypothetical protein ABIV25_05260 [Paracoccaceae bacterium]